MLPLPAHACHVPVCLQIFIHAYNLCAAICVGAVQLRMQHNRNKHGFSINGICSHEIDGCLRVSGSIVLHALFINRLGCSRWYMQEVPASRGRVRKPNISLMDTICLVGPWHGEPMLPYCEWPQDQSLNDHGMRHITPQQKPGAFSQKGDKDGVGGDLKYFRASDTRTCGASPCEQSAPCGRHPHLVRCCRGAKPGVNTANIGIAG